MNYNYVNKNKKSLKPYIGNQAQLARIRKSVLCDGKGTDLKIADFNNGSGLSFTIVPDRGMDIQEASYKGVPLAWFSPVGYCNPAFYNAEGLEWLRTWPGGLMTGCGLRNVGGPGVDDGEEYGLHGRLSHIPAENCNYSEKWLDDKFVLSMTGEVRETRMFGENLLLTRKVSCVMGEGRIIIEDTIENQGFRPSQLMLLYHINFGYPLVSESAELIAKEHSVVPRDEEASTGIDSWEQFQEPTKGYVEQCFYHDIPAADDGMSRIAIRNKDLGLEVEVAYRKKELSNLTQWKQMGQGEYVVGLEPGNCHPEGVAAERDKFNNLQVMEPDEKVTARVEISIKEIE